MTDGETSVDGTDHDNSASGVHHKWMCTGCGKVISSQPFGRCTDCGGNWKTPTEEDLACDECGDPDAHGIFGSTERLCTRHLAERQYMEDQSDG
jgi:predicted ATP-dependent serine protease